MKDHFDRLENYSHMESLTKQEVEMRKRLVNFTQRDAQLLTDLRDVFQEAADDVVTKFYGHITKFNELNQIINKHSTVDRLKQTQKEYFIQLAEGTYDLEYFQRRYRIGQVHDKISLKPKYYIGAYTIYYNEVLPLIKKKYQADPEAMMDHVQAFLKIVNIDMQIAIETYIAAFMEVNTVIDTLEDTSNTVSDVAKDLAGSTSEISIASDDLAQKIVDISGESQNQAQNAITATDEIKNLAQSSQESVKKIQVAVDTIDKIADQTNLLALNATIEAARAGEYGRGFSVVAQEVKKLAVESSEAAKEIGSMVKGIQRDTEESSAKTVELIEDISEALKHIALATEEASASTEEQSATIHELANSAQVLAEIVESLEGLVEKFKEKLD